MSAQREKTASTVETIGKFLKRVKAAEVGADPGGQDGKTDLPVESVDNGTMPPSEGERSAENEKQVKQDVPASVNEAPKATQGNLEEDHLQIGLRQSSTGNDPAVENDRKGNLEDPGTSSPATFSDGEKYASLNENSSWEELTSAAQKIGEALCGSLSKRAAAGSTATPAAPKQNADAGHLKTAEERAMLLGWQVAGLADETLTKEAIDNLLVQSVAARIDYADVAAEKVAAYLTERLKKADDDGDEDDAPNGEGGDDDDDAPVDPMMSDAEPSSGFAEETGDPAAVEAAVMQALSGGGDIPTEEALMAMLAGEGGGMGGGEAPPPDAGAGGMSEEDMMLLAALQEAGAQPDALLAASEDQAKIAAATLQASRRVAKLASAGAKQTYKPKNAADKKRFDAIRGYIKELVPSGK